MEPNPNLKRLKRNRDFMGLNLFCNVVFNLTSNYLDQYHGHKHQIIQCMAGVSQGSEEGLFLRLIYINDLTYISSRKLFTMILMIFMINTVGSLQ